MAIRHAIRSLVRSPWYAVTAIGTITLTIALSATAFAVIDGVLFRPLPYPDADGVFRVTGVDATGGSASLAPADVDRRRAEVGLSPLAEYREMLKRLNFPDE
jgi:hypothetical protein